MIECFCSDHVVAETLRCRSRSLCQRTAIPTSDHKTLSHGEPNKFIQRNRTISVLTCIHNDDNRANRWDIPRKVLNRVVFAPPAIIPLTLAHTRAHTHRQRATVQRHTHLASCALMSMLFHRQFTIKCKNHSDQPVFSHNNYFLFWFCSRHSRCLSHQLVEMFIIRSPIARPNDQPTPNNTTKKKNTRSREPFHDF